jgi:hypothetical protein
MKLMLQETIPTILEELTGRVLLDKRDPKLLQQESYKGAETDSRAIQ